MPHFFASLRFRLLLLVLLALVPVLGLVIYTASEQRRLAATQAQENALRLARAAASSQEQLVEGAHQLLIVLAQLPAVRNRDPVACSAFLANLLKQYPYATSFGVTDRDGYVFCNALLADKPINIANDPFFLRVLETRDFAVGEYRIGPITGKSTLAFGYPLLDEMGQVQAVVFASLDLASLNQLAAQSLMPPGSTLTMRDRNGTILARYPDPEKWVGRSVMEVTIVKIIQGQQSEGTAEAFGVDGVPRLYAFTPVRGVPQRDIYISVGVPTAVAFAEANQVLVRNLVALGLVAVLALAAAWIGGDLFLFRRVHALLAVTRRLVEGDMSARTRLRYGVGELSQLARAFDQMAEGLEQRETERRRAYEAMQQEERTRARLLHQVITAQEDERIRIARELHDETSQSLTALMVGLDTARLALGDQAPKVDEHLQTARSIAEGMLENIHRLIGDLRPSPLDDLGLMPAIAWYGEQRLNPMGIVLHLDQDGLQGRLPPAMETVLFRIVQEAITNVVRHARASVANVHLAYREGYLTLQVADNGQGFDPSSQLSDPHSKGFGLPGIQERVSILGGEFHMQTAPGQGTVITVRVPVPEGQVAHV